MDGKNIAEVFSNCQFRLKLRIRQGHPLCRGIDPAVDKALDEAASALTKAGYEVEFATPPSIKAIYKTYMGIMFTEMSLVKDSVVNKFGSGQLRRTLDHYLQLQPPLGLAEYAQGLARRSHFHREWDQFQRRYPIILSPLLTTPPYIAGADLVSVEVLESVLDSACCMAAMNFLDLPSMSLPTQVRALGVPIGVQLIGPRYGEQHVLEAAQAVEDTCGTPSDELLISA